MHTRFASHAENAEPVLGPPMTVTNVQSVVIEIGGMPIVVRSDSPEFLAILWNRYGGFVNPIAEPIFELEVEITPDSMLPGAIDPDEDLSVRFEGHRWVLERGDFRAELDPAMRHGHIRQAATPYAIDAAFRVLHSLLLAKQGGLLVHAASAVRNGRAFLFAGVSGAGKTTISRLAPPDVTLLTDEISYLRREGDGYVAFGTPFAGELGQPGENVHAPLATLYLLTQGPENRIDPVSQADATRAVLESVLFFAHDSELVERVFDSVCDLVQRVPIKRLTFVPDSSVWEAIV
jgi:hypothetical protein